MKKTLFIFSLIFITLPQSAIANLGTFNDKVQLQNSNGTIKVVASDCKVVDQEAEAFYQWGLSRKDNVKKPGKCSCSGGVCSSDIGNSIPNFAKYINNKNALHEGPNSFTATFAEAEVLPDLSFVSTDEADWILNSPLCRRRSEGEAPKPGDVVAVSVAEVTNRFSYTHVTENIAFAKFSIDKNAAYEFQDPKNFHDFHELKKECRDNNPKSIHCSKKLIYYDCMTFNEFEAKHKISDQRIKQAQKVVRSMDCELSHFLHTSRNPSALDDTMMKTIKTLESIVSENVRMSNKHEKIFWMAMTLRLRSMEQQVSNIIEQ